ncbi:MAG: ZIP family metal transporter [Candidatus Hodarchaeales archaeon]
MVAYQLTVLFYGSIAGFATLLGIVLMRNRQAWAIKRSQYVNSFAAGLILSLVFFHLMPEASELSDIAFPVVFLGFFSFYLLENFIIIHSGSELHFHETDPCLQHASEANSVMAFSGLVLHSLIDGIIIGVGFELGNEIGILASLAVISHEVPEGVTSFALINETLPDKAVILSVIVALATPLGALISLIFIGNLTDNTIGVLLALAAGTFIYVSASDLIPNTHSAQNLKTMIAFLLGAVLIIVISLLS